MTIGIYALYWEKQDLIYIGKSSQLEIRKEKHLRELRYQKHSNYKVQDAYNSYGIPEFKILEYCLPGDMNIKEIAWQDEFNSLSSLDIVRAGNNGGYGTNAANSIYTKFQILSAFRLLSANNTLITKDIEAVTKVSSDTLISILAEKSHQWLNSTYPFRYRLMIERRAQRNIKNQESRRTSEYRHGLIEIISPEGKIISITNITKFARDNNLDQAHLSKVINKQRQSHKGWKLHNKGSI